nr:hypothetical protein [Mucilaginibacter sp. L294]
MKKILYILLLLPIFMAGCRKDPSNKNGNADSYEGYVIQGKMKGVIVANSNLEQPFVMTFMAGNKVKLVNVSGETTLNYSVQEGKLVLDDNGYFNVVNKQITDWVIAGLNITKATLIAKPATNQLRGKKFSGTLQYSGLPFTFDTELDFDANADNVVFPGADPPQYSYTPQGNVAGYLYDSPSKSGLFFMIDNGKLEYASYSPESGVAVTTLNPK